MSSEARPTVVKFADWMMGRMWAFVLVPILGGLAALAGPGHWPHNARYLAVVAFASLLLSYRFWRMGVRFDDRGVRIRGFLRTNRFGWPEVSHFEDGGTAITGGGSSADFWALAVVLHDGRAITVKATAARAITFNPEAVRLPPPKVLAAIAQVAARYQIPAKLTGVMPPHPLPPRRNRQR